jgi:hypothetical protein
VKTDDVNYTNNVKSLKVSIRQRIDDILIDFTVSQKRNIIANNKNLFVG